MPFKTIVTELLWFLQGNTNIKYLVDNNCHIWDGDAFKNYVNIYKGNFPMGMEEFIETVKTNDKFAERWGNLGPIYGKQWRGWNSIDNSDFDMRMNVYEVDQIRRLIADLTNNPDSRRMMVNAWNVGELDQMVLPPCHYGFQVYTRELSMEERVQWVKDNASTLDTLQPNYVIEGVWKESTPKRAISLMWNQRSVDTFLGLPFNIASYGLLLMMLADEVNMVPDQLIGNLGDVHLYSNHIEQAKEQIQREGFDLPTVHVRDGIYCSSIEDVLLFDYESHPAIKAPLSN
jgi:thymidylate synthase